MKTKYIISVILLALLIGCSCPDPDPDPDPLIDSSTQTTNIGGTVQLGLMKESSVTISSLDGYILEDNLITNTKGQYFPHKTTIRKNIDEYNPSMKLLLITTYGGIDTDPNDDGIFEDGEEIEVKGQVKLIISVEEFFKNKEHSVNLITTAIADIIENYNITEEKILHIAKELGVADINDDGNITMDDLVYYQMAKHESRAESYLRTNFLDKIHKNEKDKIRDFIKKIKMSQSIIQPIIMKKTNKISVKFNELNDNSYIRYKVKTNNSESTYTTYSSEDIELVENSILYFQECVSSNECFKLQKVLYDGKNYFFDYSDYEKPQEFFSNKTELQTLLNNTNKSKDKLSKINRELEVLKNELTEIDGKDYGNL